MSRLAHWQRLFVYHRGPSSLAGVAVICIMMPVTKAVAKYMGGLQRSLMVAKDKRIEVNSEVLGAMKVVKVCTFGYTMPFACYHQECKFFSSRHIEI